MLKLMRLKFNALNLPTVHIGNFRAVMKETLLHVFSTSMEKKAFSFEIVCALAKPENEYFWKSLRGTPSSELIETDFFMRVKYIKDMKFCNDRVKLSKIIHFFPDILAKYMNSKIDYCDLLEIADCMLKQYQLNYTNPDLRDNAPLTNTISYFIHRGQLPATQNRNSAIKVTSRQYIMNEFPILLYRTAITCSPMRMLAIMLPSSDTIEFYIYSLESNIQCTKLISVDEAEVAVPFIRRMLTQDGFREVIGHRLFTAFKNSLLMELLTKEKNATQVLADKQITQRRDRKRFCTVARSTVVQL